MGTKAHRRARGRALSEDEEAAQDVGAQIEGAAAAPLDDSGFAEFSLAGTAVAGEFRCSDCGYGAVVRRALPSCPMCGSTVWESRPPRFVD